MDILKMTWITRADVGSARLRLVSDMLATPGGVHGEPHNRVLLLHTSTTLPQVAPALVHTLGHKVALGDVDPGIHRYPAKQGQHLEPAMAE
jgi:hypothetical protein